MHDNSAEFVFVDIIRHFRTQKDASELILQEGR